MTKTIEVYSITKHTEVNGPGVRNMVHVQGCTLGCRGCFNTPTWPSKTESSQTMQVYDLAEQLLEGDIDGVTISGGEPMQQPEATFNLMEELTSLQPNVHILLYTGYSKAELDDAGLLERLLELADIAVFGRFELDKLIPQPHSELRGSRNQEVYQKTLAQPGDYSEESISLEFHLKPGKVEVTGFPDKDFIKKIRKELGG